MRKSLLGLCGPLLFMGVPAGCALPMQHETIGWRFEIGKPGTIATPSTVEQTNGPLVVNGMASMPANGQLRGTLMPTAAECPPAQAGVPVTAALAPRGCTLDDVCAKLDRLDLRMTQQQRVEGLPMPKGAP